MRNKIHYFLELPLSHVNKIKMNSSYIILPNTWKGMIAKVSYTYDNNPAMEVHHLLRESWASDLEFCVLHFDSLHEMRQT